MIDAMFLFAMIAAVAYFLTSAAMGFNSYLDSRGAQMMKARVKAWFAESHNRLLFYCLIFLAVMLSLMAVNSLQK